jgi:hypothetical protein
MTDTGNHSKNFHKSKTTTLITKKVLKMPSEISIIPDLSRMKLIKARSLKSFSTSLVSYIFYQGTNYTVIEQLAE